jgi:hypothetical protein
LQTKKTEERAECKTSPNHLTVTHQVSNMKMKTMLDMNEFIKEGKMEEVRHTLEMKV